MADVTQRLVFLCEQNIIVLRPSKLDQPQIRPLPVDSILADGQAINLLMQRCNTTIIIPPAIIHFVQISILKNRHVVQAVPLPGAIAYKNDFTRHGVMKNLARLSLKRFNQISIDKKLTTICNINRGGIFRLPRSRLDTQDDQ